MQKLTLLAMVMAATITLAACGGSKGGGSSSVPSLSAADGSITLKQNSSASIDLISGAGGTVVITRPAAHGKVIVSGGTAKYRATHPLYSGSDSFAYKIVDGAATSNEATVSVTLTPLASGTTVHSENYLAQNFALAGWKSFSSAAGHTASSSVQFQTGVYNGAAADTRRFGIYGDVNSYAGDALYTSLFGSLPADGAAGAMQDWPWKADLLHIPECGVDATVTIKMIANGGTNPMGAILLNYDIDFNSVTGAQDLTGYHLLVNGGGGSLTLSRFEGAHELATAYMDRWPNSNHGNEAMANPVEGGPYKGWNYRNGVWPAGGNVGTGTAMHVAVRYQYDPAADITTISYEARRLDGTDMTPGVWDEAVVLNGGDSLPSGGGFGVMALNYHPAGLIIPTDFDIAEFKAQCVLP